MMSNKVRPPRNGTNSNSSDCTSNGTRNHRFNTVHATVLSKPPAVVVAGLTLRACARALVAPAQQISRGASRSPSVFS
jgi:hypothetical protein